MKCFRGITDDELDAMVDSFRFEQCIPHEGLAAVLSDGARMEPQGGALTSGRAGQPDRDRS